MSENKKKLIELEKTGDYVFHGSPDRLEILEPRQGYNYDQNLKKMVADVLPAISATPFIEVAIFRSIINHKNIAENHESSFGYDSDKGLEFSATPNVFESVKDKKGFIHVLDKKDFYKYNSDMEWRSDKQVKPVFIFEINSNDLPEKIDIIKQ